MRRTYRYRLYPTRQQAAALGTQVDEACRLYNAALDERRSAWRMHGISIRYLDQAGRWDVGFVVEIPEPELLPACEVAVGIDVGLTTFAVLSDGSEIANPRHFRAAERRLRVAQRKLARRRRRSRRRLKARQGVARLHAHVRNQRRDVHHKTARALVERYGLVAVEDLNTRALAGSLLAKSVDDAGWGQFLSILADKAACAGRRLVRANPAGTTQACSACGVVVPKTLAERWRDCPTCGLSLGRDHNAALNILRRALDQTPGWGVQAATVEDAHAVA